MSDPVANMAPLRATSLQLAITSAFILCSSFVLVWIIYIPGPLPFLEGARLDADLINAIQQGTYGSFDPDPSFANTVIVYGTISSAMDPRLFLGLFGCGSLWLVGRSVTCGRQLLLAAIWITVAILLVLNVAGKDVIVVCLTMLVVGCVIRFRASLVTIAAISGLYAFYAYAFRQYYFLILFGSFGLLLIGRLKSRLRVFLFLAVGVFAFTVAGNFISEIEQDRDQTNIARYQYDESPIRTAFVNPLSTATLTGRIGNFGYAALRLFLPVIWGGTIKDLLFSAYSGALIWTLWICWSQENRELRIIGALLSASVLISILFEPDVGSFARHSCTMFPFLIVVFRHWPYPYNRNRLVRP